MFINCSHRNCIIPDYVMKSMSECDCEQTRERVRRLMDKNYIFQGMKVGFSQLGVKGTLLNNLSNFQDKEQTSERYVFDFENRSDVNLLPGRIRRQERQGEVDDVAVNEAYDFSGKVSQFYKENFGRNSIDNQALPLVSTVHFDRDYMNAFWNGQQMVYGDGDGVIFKRFTVSVDVIAHELTHGVSQYDNGLVYSGQSGALNEHLSDVMGILTKQWLLNESVSESSWLIGEGLFTEQSGVRGLRSFTNEKAYENNRYLGTDIQPKHYSQLYTGLDDNGGVHINSGIPNHAFYLFAMSLGGNAWEKAGLVWYFSLMNSRSRDQFSDFRETTEFFAKRLFGQQSQELRALQSSWLTVGVSS